MASVLAKVSGVATSGNLVLPALNVSSGGSIYLALSFDSPGGEGIVPSVSDTQSNSWSHPLGAKSTTHNNGGPYSFIWWIYVDSVVSTGTTTITLTNTNSNSCTLAVAYSLAGTTSSTFDNSHTGTGDGTGSANTVNPSVSVTNAKELVLVGLNAADTAAPIQTLSSPLIGVVDINTSDSSGNYLDLITGYVIATSSGTTTSTGTTNESSGEGSYAWSCVSVFGNFASGGPLSWFALNGA
jgi:hypothetical protein